MMTTAAGMFVLKAEKKEGLWSVKAIKALPVV